MAYSTLEDIKKLVPESTLVQLTDDAAVCAGGKTFGIRFYVRPGNARNLRVVEN